MIFLKESKSKKKKKIWGGGGGGGGGGARVSEFFFTENPNLKNLSVRYCHRYKAKSLDHDI